jgi:hypothetical protein
MVWATFRGDGARLGAARVPPYAYIPVLKVLCREPVNVLIVLRLAQALGGFHRGLQVLSLQTLQSAAMACVGPHRLGRRGGGAVGRLTCRG